MIRFIIENYTDISGMTLGKQPNEKGIPNPR